jgi:hypothetical protein
VGIGHSVYEINTPGLLCIIQYGLVNISLIGFVKDGRGGYKNSVEHVRPVIGKWSISEGGGTLIHEFSLSYSVSVLIDPVLFLDVVSVCVCVYIYIYIYTDTKGNRLQRGVKPAASRQLDLAINVYITVYGWVSGCECVSVREVRFQGSVCIYNICVFACVCVGGCTCVGYASLYLIIF